ncbi:hypothetical protein [Proteiniclasticum sp.]|uniref:hypothetical protein n=1 Tax=Proteiniclasticum sp. TaxID=2053595 RepID=UPI002899357A|nr:hypothetical protein [Proteiniclasticum sp.]
MKRRNKIVIAAALLILGSAVSIGCKSEEVTPYTQNIVVDGQALPFHMSSFEYNNEEDADIELKLHQIFGTSLGKQMREGNYIIVNHDGDDLTEEFIGEQMPSSEDIAKITREIKESGYLVVNPERYRVTTIEKEIKALFNNERRIHPQEKLKEVLEANRESFEEKDYESINLYLLRNRIIVFSTSEEKK